MRLFDFLYKDFTIFQGKKQGFFVKSLNLGNKSPKEMKKTEKNRYFSVFC